jgi:RNA polymerase subunit RPABC4/transcription elongation factor Spt4
MNKVKVCPECHKCNNKMSNLCENCGRSITNEPIIKVEDNIDFFIIEDTQTNKQLLEDAPISKLYKCPNCDNFYSATDILCPTCHQILRQNDSNMNYDTSEKEVTLLSHPTTKIALLLLDKEVFVTNITVNQKVVVGRLDFNNINLNSNLYISRKHFTLGIVDKTITICDVSSNGTKLNEIFLPKNIPTVLNNGDRLGVDEIVLAVQIYAD